MDLRTYGLVTGAYWSLTITDGALRMLVLLHFHNLGYGPLELSFLFLAYELMGVITNLLGGWAGSRSGLQQTLKVGLGLQIASLTTISFVGADWNKVLSVFFVMACQAVSGVAKDLTKMSSKSAVKLVVRPEENKTENPTLFKWVAILTGSKNALKGAGFFIGSALLTWIGFRKSLVVMAGLVTIGLLCVLLFLREEIGRSKETQRLRILSSHSPAITRLSTARIFLFGSRDIWFVVALPIFLDEELGWSFNEIGGFLACWIIGYGIVQSWTPALVRRLGRGSDIAQTTKVWALLLASVTVVLALLVTVNVSTGTVVVGGLLLFGLVFAINSSVHSFLILAYTNDDDVVINVGFYYAANAFGRLSGTLLSGITYLIGGMPVALWVSAGFLILNWYLSLNLPSLRQPIEDQ
ncbi:MAG: organoarsenical effux MFS transporter ArsJ [Acidimicrobiales bacterium]|nr:organoarsenical effux MFS transporter ArsJ [Acidimicrobiales bacterium]